MSHLEVISCDLCDYFALECDDFLLCFLTRSCRVSISHGLRSKYPNLHGTSRCKMSVVPVAFMLAGRLCCRANFIFAVGFTFCRSMNDFPVIGDVSFEQRIVGSPGGKLWKSL